METYSAWMVLLPLVVLLGAVALAKKSLKYVDAPVPPPAKLTRLAAQPHDDAGHGEDHGHGGAHH